MDKHSFQNRLHLPTTGNIRLHSNWLKIVRTLWIAAALFFVGLFLVSIPAEYNRLFTTFCPQRIDGLNYFGLSLHFCTTYITVVEVLFAIPFILIGVIIFWRKSNDFVALIVALMMIGVGVSYWYVPDALMNNNPIWTVPVVSVESFTIVLVFFFTLIFPNGQFVPRWTRYVAVFWGLWSLLWPFFFNLNPFNWPNEIQAPLLLVIYGTGLYAQFYRYRQVASPLQQQQTRWIVIGLTLALVGWIGYLIGDGYYSAGGSGGGPILFYLIAQPISSILIAALPTTMAIALLRYRLWDVDFVINRGLIYGAVTLILGLIYFLSVGLLEQVFQQSNVALGASILVIGFLFQPLRIRTRTFIDHRVYHDQVPMVLHKVEPTIGSSDAQAGIPQIAGYQVMEHIGSGGMADVFKARQITLNRLVAIKILPSDKADDDFRKRFEREAQTVATLRHPNIVEMFDFGNANGLYYMVMEYIAGQDLAAYLRGTGPLAVSQALPILADIARALDYAHEHGLIHRDVKPSNVMLQPQPDKNYRAVLMDFGIAKIMTGSSEITRTGLLGTLDYIAPEQIMSATKIDNRADIYSLGVIAYQMLTGTLPFKGDNPGSVILGHLQLPAPDPRSFVPDLSPEVANILLSTLAKDPISRPSTGAQFISLFDRLEITPLQNNLDD